jgi:hypothetical protein
MFSPRKSFKSPEKCIQFSPRRSITICPTSSEIRKKKPSRKITFEGIEEKNEDFVSELN